MAHAILSPSGADKWLNCPPSARFEEQIPEETSIYAEEGTLAHSLAALLLEFKTEQIVGKLFYGDLEKLETEILDFYSKIGGCDPELELKAMHGYVKEYFDFVLELGGKILIERQYDLGQFVPLAFGTSDASNLVGTTLYITDLKYGSGKRVTAKANNQLRLYALGAYLELSKSHKIENMIMTIYQPRAGGISSDEISVLELLDWAENVVKPKALLAIAGQGDFKAGKHCQFCKAKSSCMAHFQLFEKLNDIRLSNLMTDEDLVFVLEYGGIISSWIKKVTDDTVTKMQGGKEISGFKLVAGKGKRVFTDEADVIDSLIGAGIPDESIFTTELRNLTDLEKLLGKKKFPLILGDYICTQKARPQIVSDSDARPSISENAADIYDEEDLTE